VGRGGRIGAGAVLYGPTTLGEENQVFACAVLGGPPQDVGYAGEPTRLEIGDRNVFREGVTISRGAPKSHGLTRIGSENYFMANAHVGHDSVVEDRCVLANNVMIAGHCHVATGANLAGGVALVQFVSVGRLAFIGGLAGTRQDCEPFIIHDRVSGHALSQPRGINRVGLRRAGLADEAIRHLQTAYKLLFMRGGREDPDRAAEELRGQGALTSEVEELLDFIRRKRDGRLGRQLDGKH
jgi:UDP-N-acetylglucosamine acyltransferase